MSTLVSLSRHWESYWNECDVAHLTVPEKSHEREDEREKERERERERLGLSSLIAFISAFLVVRATYRHILAASGKRA